MQETEKGKVRGGGREGRDVVLRGITFVCLVTSLDLFFAQASACTDECKPGAPRKTEVDLGTQRSLHWVSWLPWSYH